jgi:predicted metal-binding protein
VRAVCGEHKSVTPCGTGAARRLLQHLQSCHGEVAEEALENFSSCKFAASRRCPKQTRQRKSRQQRRLIAMDFQFD